MDLLFVIWNDHNSIRDLLQQFIEALDQQAYVQTLLGFQFCIEYKTRTSNKVAYALSQVPTY